jgi:L-seryl-tRNA(Ser) seleniumtransferase
MNSIYSKIPSVSLLLEKLDNQRSKINAKYLKQLIEVTISEIKNYPQKYDLENLSRDQLIELILKDVNLHLQALLSSSFRRVINATGVILHTGLGRAPLSKNDIKGIDALSGYTNLEINLSSGRRGERLDHVIPLLRILSSAEDAVVVNNNAAAVLLSLNSLAKRRDVIVSRGELVEIGGSFRMPEVMKSSGAKMVEIGATNKTHLHDYQNAINERTAAIMLVHPSNYQIVGFTAKPEIKEIIELAHSNSIPILYDLGSGALVDFSRFGFDYEPVVSDVIAAGVDVVTFSGDKLLGGPQAGIIVGKQTYLKKIKRNHLLRALRCDKLILALLATNLQKYLHPPSLCQTNVTLSLFSRSVEEMTITAQEIVQRLTHVGNSVKAVEAQGRAGSGAYPVYPIKSIALQLTIPNISAEKLARKLRLNDVPILGYIENDIFHLNLLTVTEGDSEIIVEALNQL